MKNTKKLDGTDESVKPVLSKKQLEELADIERRAIAVKCAISDTYELESQVKQRRADLFNNLTATKAEYTAKLKKFVSLLGLDPEDETLSLDVDLSTGAVTTKSVDQSKQ